MKHKITKKKKQLVVEIELDLRRSPSDNYVNYNTNNVIDLMKLEGQWQDNLICVGEAYDDNSDPDALVGQWTFTANVEKPKVVLGTTPKKKAPKKKAPVQVSEVKNSSKSSPHKEKNIEG